MDEVKTNIDQEQYNQIKRQLEQIDRSIIDQVNTIGNIEERLETVKTLIHKIEKEGSLEDFNINNLRQLEFQYQESKKNLENEQILEH